MSEQVGLGQRQPAIRVGKHAGDPGRGDLVEVFSLSLGDETIELHPFRTWNQLDIFKWGARGKLPGTPPGLEVTPDHIKIAGEIVSIAEPDGCARLQKVFDEWLTLEKGSLELARAKQKGRGKAASAITSSQQSPLTVQFRVEVDKRGQVHVLCLRGNETAATIGLAVQGFNGLCNQGLMRKPRMLDVGAMHDWVELDGELCSFEHGNNDAQKLEKLLNDRYVPITAPGAGKDILVFSNAASPTGFDIQFPVMIGGVLENRRRILNEAALEWLQDSARCGLLQPGLIIKLTPPTFILKHKTPEGGETYLPKGPATTVTLSEDDGRARCIDLSQPVNYAKLSVVELTAVLNHPAINRHVKSEAFTTKATVTAVPASGPPCVSDSKPIAPSPTASSEPSSHPPTSKAELIPMNPISIGIVSPPSTTPPAKPLEDCGLRAERKPGPNLWLKEILAQKPVRHDWFVCLVYERLAQRFGNSFEGKLGPIPCWWSALGKVTDLGAPEFKGIFLTQKSGFGFVGNGRMARFHHDVVFLGTLDSVVEGIDIQLLAVGMDVEGHLIFIVSNEYQSKFGVPSRVIAQESARLNEAGASILSSAEILDSPQPLEVAWTVPADHFDRSEPKAVEILRQVALATGSEASL
jgi:hypothetical protein